MSAGELSSALHSFGCHSSRRKKLTGISTTTVRWVQKRKIGVQPEAVKRRKIRKKGKRELLKGGTVLTDYQR